MKLRINNSELHITEKQWDIISQLLFPSKEVGKDNIKSDHVEILLDSIVVGYSTEHILKGVLTELGLSAF